MKRCTKCGETKDDSKFSKKVRGGSALMSWCKVCRSDSTKRWQRENPEARKRIGEKWVATNYKQHALHSARNNARRRGVPFNLIPADLPDVPAVCPALGIPLVIAPGSGRQDGSPSLDRLIPHLGYVPGNVAWVSWRANMLKCDATLEELELVTAWTRQRVCEAHSLSEL